MVKGESLDWTVTSCKKIENGVVGAVFDRLRTLPK
jgi:hypothetical protein